MRLKAIIACLLWGSAFAVAKIGFEYLPPVLLSGLRFSLAGLLLIPIILIRKENVRGAFKHWPFMLLFAFLQTFLQYGLFFMGLDKVSAATSAIIIGAGPLFIAIMAHLTLRDDKMTLRKTIAIVLGLAGVAFISLAKGSLSADSPQFWLGVALLVSSNILGSYTNIMVVKKRSWNLSPIVLTSFANFTGGVLLIIASLLVEKPVVGELPAKFYAALVWLAIIPAAAFSIWYTLLQKPGVKVSELNMWKFVVPVSGVLLSWMLAPGETPDIISLLGIVIITAALLLLQLPEKYFQRSALRK